MPSQPIAWPFSGLFVTLTLILAACGGAPATAPLPIASQTPTAASSAGAATPQQPQDAIKVTVWTHGGTAQEVEALTQILEHFRARRPDISVHLVYVPQDKYNAQVQAAFYGVSMAYPVITTAFAEAFKNIAHGANVKAELDQAAQQIDQDIKDHNGYSVRK